MKKKLFFSVKYPILFFDGGYIQCHRIHATINYLKHKYPDFHEETFAPVIIQSFEHHLRKQIEHYKKKLKIPFENMFLCLDVPMRTTWRYDLYPLYKVHRMNSQDENGGIESKKYKDAMIHVFSESGIQIIEQNKLEADDIIALSIKKIKSMKPTQSIIIMTSDYDFKQLLKYPFLYIKDAKLRPLELSEKDAETELWIKVVMGDKSDNIPPIFPKCGIKTARNLATDKEKAISVFDKKNCHNKFARNYNLVAMEAIPDEIEKKFYHQFEFIILQE